MTFTATARCLGLESSDVPSKSTVHRRRKDSRAQAGLQLREQMAGLPPGLVLLWNVKLLPDISGGSDTVDRIAVVVTGEGVEQFLGVPKAVDGSGREMASVVHSAITSLEIADKIVGLSFDTTASNTGMLKGACMRLEEALGKNLLWLTFRHHVHELLLKEVFHACLGVSSGPDILLFKTFKDAWAFLNQGRLETVDDDPAAVDLFLEDETLRRLREDMVKYLQDVATSREHPREDYQELLVLSLLYLGGKVPGYNLRRPGYIIRQDGWRRPSTS